MVRGKAVMITGAARGIGASMARLLHQRGARLVLVEAIEQRKRRVDVPRWVAAARWLKPALSTSLADRTLSGQIARIETR